MKKNFILLFFLLLLFTVTPLTALALTPAEPDKSLGEYIMPPQPDGQIRANIFGQNHSYSVLFRGNGEAIVTARLVFSNQTDQTQTSYRLRIPRVQIQDVLVYQQVRRSRCLNYITPPSPEASSATLCPLYTTQQECLQANKYQPADLDRSLLCHWLPCANRCLPRGITKATACPDPVCTYWEDPDYSNYSYGNNDYRKLQYVQTGDELEIQLEKPLDPQKSTALLLNFRAFGFARKNILGGYNFVFETVKIQDKIYNLQVGISVDSDLLLRQETGSINYFPESGTGGVTMRAPMMEKGVTSTQLDDYYNQVGVGAVTKTASNLQPSESYTVKGTYADKSYKLYSREIFLGLSMVLVISVLIYLGAKHLLNYYRKMTRESPLASTRGRRAKALVAKGIPRSQALPLTESMAVSIISSLIFLASLIFYFFIFPAVRYNLFAGPSSYNYYALHPFQSMISLLVIICLILIDLVILIGPVVWIGKRRGHFWATVTVVLTVFWLSIYIVLVFFVYTIMFNRTYFDYGIPVPTTRIEPVIQPEMMKGEVAQ